MSLASWSSPSALNFLFHRERDYKVRTYILSVENLTVNGKKLNETNRYVIAKVPNSVGEHKQRDLFLVINSGRL